MMKRMIVVVAFALAAMTSLAVDWNFASNKNDTGLSGATWKRADDPSVTSTTLNSEDDYFILSGSAFTGYSDAQIFTGNSLTIGTVGGSASQPTLKHYYSKGIHGTSDLTFQNKGVFLAGGTWEVSYGAELSPHVVYGPVAVTAVESSPFRFTRTGTSANGLRFMDAFKGEGFVSVEPGGASSFFLALLGDYSDYSGTVTLNPNVAVEPIRYTMLQLKAGTSRLTANVGSHCRLQTVSAGDVVTIGKVHLAAGAVLDLVAADSSATGTRTVTCSKFVVTDEFTAEPGVKVSVSFADSAKGRYASEMDVLTVPEDTDLDESAFVLIPYDMQHSKATFSVRPDAAAKTKTLVLTFEGSGHDLLTLAATGNNNKGLTGVTWSDGSIGTSPEYDYAVQDGKTIYISSNFTPNHNPSNEFYGASLRIGDVFLGSSGSLYQYGGYPVTAEIPSFGPDGLILACGEWRSRYAHAHVVSGKVEVVALEASPFRIYSANDSGNPANASLTLLGPLSGSGSCQVDAGLVDKNVTTNYSLKVFGGAADFTGTLTVSSQVAVTSLADCHAGLFLTNGPMPAAVTIGHGSYLVLPEPGDAATFRALTLDDGAELRVTTGTVGSGETATHACGSLSVTDDFTVRGKVRLFVEMAEDDFVGGTFPILTVPSACELSAGDFDLVLSNDGSFFNRGMTFSVVEGQGTKSLTLAIPLAELVYQVATDGSTTVLTNNPESFKSSLTNATAWSDGAVPHEGSHYICKAPSGGERILRTPTDQLGAWTFPGETLSFIGNDTQIAHFVLLYTDFTIPVLRFIGLSELHMKHQAGGSTVHGEICVEKGLVTWTSYAGGSFTHDGELTGAGDLVLTGMGNGTSNHGGIFELKGTNVNYTGTLRLTIGEYPKDDVPSPTFDQYGRYRFQRLYTTDGRNFGGAMDPANPKGVVIESCSQIITRNSIMVDEPSRGWYIGMMGQFDVAEADHVMTFRSPLAVNGILVKDGAGVLALGNETVTFGADGTAAEPSGEAGTHAFLLADGSVKPLSAGCLDGLDVVVSNGTDTAFILDLDPADETLRTKGIVNVKTSHPFAVAEGTSFLTVGFDVASAPADYPFTVAIATVKASAADAVRPLLRLVRPRVNGRKLGASLVEIPDVEAGSVTFAAKFTPPPGMLLLVR